MLFIFRQTLVPLLSLFIFVLGSGFFSTLLALDMNLHNEPAILIGAMTGLYYAGLVCGSFRMEHFIIRIGHIRAFSTFASALAVISLLHGIVYNMAFWLTLRFLGGIATAGLFIVIESWLLCRSTVRTRGQVLSLYMITFYAAQAMGQFLINLANPQDLLLYAVTAMLCSLSVIPLSMTSVEMPTFDKPSTINIKTLYQSTASGIFGCFLSGMIMSATYGLFPLYFSNFYHDRQTVSFLMFCLIMGGMLLQYPVGKVSDIIDRRLVVIVISVLTISCCLGLMLSKESYFTTVGLITIFGGLTFTIYPVSISHACDSLESEDIIAGIQTLLLSYSIGATLGPFVAPIAMHSLDRNGLFVYFIVISGLISLLFSWRKTQVSSPEQDEPFQLMTQTTPVSVELDPRADETAGETSS